jgi:hypothetical protein
MSTFRDASLESAIDSNFYVVESDLQLTHKLSGQNDGGGGETQGDYVDNNEEEDDDEEDKEEEEASATLYLPGTSSENIGRSPSSRRLAIPSESHASQCNYFDQRRTPYSALWPSLFSPLCGSYFSHLNEFPFVEFTFDRLQITLNRLLQRQATPILLRRIQRIFVHLR